MQTNPDVDAWFADLEHPLKSVMQHVRWTLLDADRRITELVQYRTVQFAYKTVLCSFVQLKDRKRITLMFNAAGRLEGEFPHLEGRSVKYMHFANPADVEARAAELTAIAAAWIAYQDG